MVFGFTMEDDDDMMMGDDGCSAVVWDSNDGSITLLQCMYELGRDHAEHKDSLAVLVMYIGLIVERRGKWWVGRRNYVLVSAAT